VSGRGSANRENDADRADRDREAGFWGGLLAGVWGVFAVPDATVRKVPPGVVRSYAVTAMVLKDQFDTNKNPEGGVLATETETNDEASLYDAVERGAFNDAASASFRSFCVMLHKQSEQLTGPDKIDFDARWGCDSEFYEALEHQNQTSVFHSDHDVPSGIAAKIRNKLFFCKAYRTRKRILSDTIEETRQLSKEKIKKLRVASDMQVGLEMMHLFIIDLLG
jgi:hypothetical protein